MSTSDKFWTPPTPETSLGKFLKSVQTGNKYNIKHVNPRHVLPDEILTPEKAKDKDGVKLLRQQINDLNSEFIDNFGQIKDKLDYLNERIDDLKQINHDIILSNECFVKQTQTLVANKSTSSMSRNNLIGIYISSICIITPLTLFGMVFYKEMSQ